MLLQTVFVLLLASSSLGVLVELDPKFFVEWTVSADRSEVTFEAIVETLGYVGLGLSSNGAMTKADIFIGGIKDNLPYFNDYHGPEVGNSAPIPDKINNFELISASENATHTIISFSRKVDTCDDEDMPITNAGLRLIWAIGASDDIAYHQMRNTKSVYILDPEIPNPDLSGLKRHNITSKIKMATDQTIYWCTMHQLPKLESRHQMIAYEPIFMDEDSKKYAHHMNILKCIRGPLADGLYKNHLYPGHPGENCNNGDFPAGDTCVFLEYGWALGGELAVNPPDVGFPFDSEQYYRLEVHLNNPDHVAGVEVEVGFQIHYTDVPQKINGSLLMVSAPSNYQLMVPQNASEFVVTAHCMPECLTMPDFPPQGLTAYNAFLHAHTSARKMRIRHYRDGKELPWIINDENYDFNYQTNRRLPNPVTIMPGDQITAECVYDTHWKDGKAVIGGSSTEDEMCMVFIAYYPAIPNFVGCYDWMNKFNMFNILGVEKVASSGKNPVVEAPASLKGKRFSEVVDEFDWTPEIREEYQYQAQHGDHVTVCLPRINVVKGLYPMNHIPYEPEDVCNPKPDEDIDQGNYGTRISATNLVIPFILIVNVGLMKYFY